jgi:hypothetical protein
MPDGTNSSRLTDPNSLRQHGFVKVHKCFFYLCHIFVLSMYRQKKLFWSAVLIQSLCCERRIKTSLIEFLECSIVPIYWYYQNNHLLLIIKSTEVILISLQLIANRSQYVADVLTWVSVLVLVFRISVIAIEQLSLTLDFVQRRFLLSMPHPTVVRKKFPMSS